MSKNFLNAWLPPLKVMPPLAYARIPKTPRRELMAPQPKKRTFGLADLLPPRRSGPSYVRELSKIPNRKSRSWPTIMIERSTRIYAGVPVPDDEMVNNLIFDSPKSTGYLFEKSEVEISAPMNQVFREKRYLIKTFFDDLSKNAFSRRGRFRRETTEKSDNKEVADSDQAENVSRLLAILARNHRTADDEVRQNNLSHIRSKRQVSYDEQKEVRENANAEKRRKSPRKSGYTPVFKECNDTAASEVSDLNAPPPPPQRRLTLQEYSLKKDIDFDRRRNRPPIDRREKVLASEITTPVPPAVEREEEEVVEEPAKETASSAKSTSNATYINLQDHQKGTQDGNPSKDANGYPLDIPPYNPDVIPYVDVPDYSDKREESLDQDDRRVAKEKFVEYPDEDADVIDPGVPLSDKKSEKIIVRDDDDASEREEQERKVKENEEVIEDEKEETVEEKEEVEDEPSPVSLDDHEDVEEEKKNEETTSKDVRNSESADDGLEFSPLQFDINDYRKPFDLEELFKEIEKDAEKVERKQKKTKEDVTENQGSKNIPVSEENHDVPSVDSAENKKEALSSERVEDTKEPLQDGPVVPPNFYEEFDKIFGPTASEKPFGSYFEESDYDHDKERPSGSLEAVKNEHEKYPYGDEDTYERLFGNKDGEDKSEPAKTEEDDETDYKSHFDDDHAGVSNKKKSSDSEETDEPTDESLEKAYKTLADILDRKDDVSRLDDEIAEKAKKEGKMPPRYKNYWTLEYGSPSEQEKT